MDTSTQMITISEAIAIVSANSNLRNIQFAPPGQIVDGGVASIIDGDTGRIVAQCRLRFSNELVYNADSTHLQLGIYLSNLTFTTRAK